MAMTLYNTPARDRTPVVAHDPARVTMYSCGPTVYDDAHIGNFRSFLFADLLRRWLEHPWCVLTDPGGAEHPGPRQVLHVMNITDVGHMTEDDDADGSGQDKMELAGQRLKEAKKSGEVPADAEVNPEDPFEVARFYESRFVEDARKLGLKVALESASDPTRLPRATDAVPDMVRQIETLIARGHAYAVGEPGAQTVYFDVATDPTYGTLSGNTLERLREGGGGRVSASHQSEKRHHADFLLWKSDRKHLMKWPSPWGTGYPGWHVECSTMALRRLDPDGTGTIDLHTGGEDNIFPHHECERAQARGATGADAFARTWAHARFLVVEGEKMSKSKGNFFTVRDLLAKGHEPAAIRLELIKTHYRANANFTEQGLKDSARMIERWRTLTERSGSGETSDAPARGGPRQEARDEARRAVTDALHDDLNIAGALGAINAWIGSVGTVTTEDAEFMRTLDAFLGVLGLERPKRAETSIGVFVGGLEPDVGVVEKLEARKAAKKAKDFSAADAIRDELLASGYAIKDVAGGQVEVSPAG